MLIDINESPTLITVTINFESYQGNEYEQLFNAEPLTKYEKVSAERNDGPVHTKAFMCCVCLASITQLFQWKQQKPDLFE